MSTKRIICPFCGKDITNSYSLTYIIPQEETIRREFSPGCNWGGNYLQETKYIRRFNSLCCAQCYVEYQKSQTLINKITKYTLPIGFVTGVIFCLYRRQISNIEFSFGGFVGCIISGVIGALLFSLPAVFLNLVHQKKTSYKRALECNSNIG